MNSRTFRRVSAIVVLGFTLLPATASGQQETLREQLQGAWRPVAIYGQRPDGSKHDNFGAKPSGLLIFDRSGRFALQVVDPGRPPHTSNDRFKATPEEYAAIVRGGIAYSGTYTVDEADHSFTFVIERSMWEQWRDRTLKFEIKENELRYTMPPVNMNGVPVINHLVWKRAE